MNAITIATELRTNGSEKIRRLEAQTAGLQRLSLKAVAHQTALLERSEAAATPLTKRVMEAMEEKHLEFNARVASRMTSLLERTEDERKRAYVRYLIQAWYHTQFTPEFERMFGECLKAHLAADTSRFGGGNKFIRLIEEGADEELGHELWALADIEKCGGPEVIDLRRDVFPETRALVRSQFDRLNRLNFKGFLGYSFYLESYVAKHSGGQMDVMQALGIREDQISFIRNHRLVDQGHAADNIELLNFLLEDESDVDEVLDNMELIHCLYSRMAERCFE